MGKTLAKFGYPESLIKEYNNWYLLLRPDQVTIGSLILITKFGEEKYSELSKEGFAEFERIVKEIETALSDCFAYDKINYLMLMMVDPEVHYHIIPRYSHDIEFEKEKLSDFGWPALPKLLEINKISKKTFNQLLDLLKGKFQNNV